MLRQSAPMSLNQLPQGIQLHLASHDRPQHTGSLVSANSNKVGSGSRVVVVG